MDSLDLSKQGLYAQITPQTTPFDPRRSNPLFLASQPLGEWTLGPANMGDQRNTMFPGSVSHQSLPDIIDFVSGNPSSFDQFFGPRPTINPFQTSTTNFFTTPRAQEVFNASSFGSPESIEQQRLYYNEILNRIQRGDIQVDVPKTSFFSQVLKAAPAIAGAAFGGPVGGALGGAISSGISGADLKGALAGALGGGIAGAGGLGSLFGKTLGSTSGGLMDSITGGLRSIADSSFNPFGQLGGAVQGLFGVNDFTSGLGSALSLGGPGALLGGALGGKQGALLGGLGGAGIGLGLDGYLGNLFGGSGGGGLFGGGTSGGGLFGGNSSGAGGLLGGLFGGNLGGLGQLLGGGIPLALLTREAEKASDTPTGSRTPFSSVNNGAARLDPAIRNAILESMNRTRGLLGRQPGGRGILQESVGNTRSELNRARGNQNAFIQARVNPLQEQIGRQRGALERSLGLRGVSGSSFGDQALRSFGLDTERALGDARAQATQEALGFESQLNQLLGQGGQNIANFDLANLARQSQLNQQLAQGGSQLLAQELAGLGLGDQNISRLLERARLRTDLFGRAASQFGDLLGG